jgi:hypothetical protein
LRAAVFGDGFDAAAFFVPDFIEVRGFFAAVFFGAACLVADFFAFGPVFALTFAIIYPFFNCICRALLPNITIIAWLWVKCQTAIRRCGIIKNDDRYFKDLLTCQKYAIGCMLAVKHRRMLRIRRMRSIRS